MEEKRRVKRKRITKVIPDKVFFELCKAANKINDEDEYIYNFLRIKSNNYIDFRKYQMDDVQSRQMLENIFRASKMSVSEIIKESGLKKAEFSYRFCIPIRTIEDWCSGKNKCLPYIRLMFMKNLGMFKLGPHIILQSEDKAIMSNEADSQLTKLQKGKKISKEERVIYQDIYSELMNNAKANESDNSVGTDENDKSDNYNCSDCSNRTDESDNTNYHFDEKYILNVKKESKNTDLDNSYYKQRSDYSNYSNYNDYSNKRKTGNKLQTDTKKNGGEDETMLDYLDKFDYRKSSKDKISTYEQEHVHYGDNKVESILKSTDYLKNIMGNK